MLNFSDENIAGAISKSITLTLVGKARLAGDYNGDSIVDAADYIVWRSTEGQSVAASTGADGNGDGVIDDSDFDVWRTHFGQIASASGAALSASTVPEPAAFCLLGLASLAIVSGFRLRR